jgi:hypothetical protein
MKRPKQLTALSKGILGVEMELLRENCVRHRTETTIFAGLAEVAQALGHAHRHPVYRSKPWPEYPFGGDLVQHARTRRTDP